MRTGGHQFLPVLEDPSSIVDLVYGHYWLLEVGVNGVVGISR